MMEKAVEALSSNCSEVIIVGCSSVKIAKLFLGASGSE